MVQLNGACEVVEQFDLAPELDGCLSLLDWPLTRMIFSFIYLTIKILLHPTLACMHCFSALVMLHLMMILEEDQLG